MLPVGRRNAVPRHQPQVSVQVSAPIPRANINPVRARLARTGLYGPTIGLTKRTNQMAILLVSSDQPFLDDPVPFRYPPYIDVSCIGLF
jgi:hypothetical protein